MRGLIRENPPDPLTPWSMFLVETDRLFEDPCVHGALPIDQVFAKP